jgi:hypothetical protein
MICSHLGWDTDYSDRLFVDFLSAARKMQDWNVD